MQISNLSSELSEPLLKVSRLEDDLCLIKLKSGDKESFKMLYKLYAPALYGSIVRSIPDEIKSLEILENTFTYAWNNISSFDESKNKIFIWLLKAGKSITNKSL
ncbi:MULTISPECIES: hypothetical protein [unclassified Pedobacter]|uniref:hypothetical protein n=1 Tax=unclassified Pedobacter TaxID=2628915 RepID=UPI001E3B3AED|nr:MULTISPECIES: hypothetical protein [unclassified Pedobacter]